VRDDNVSGNVNSNTKGWQQQAEVIRSMRLPVAEPQQKAAAHQKCRIDVDSIVMPCPQLLPCSDGNGISSPIKFFKKSNNQSAKMSNNSIILCLAILG